MKPQVRALLIILLNQTIARFSDYGGDQSRQMVNFNTPDADPRTAGKDGTPPEGAKIIVVY